MALTLSAVTLPIDLIWIDERSWSPVVQKLDYSVTGALLVQEATKLAGKPVTLQGTREHGWATGTQVDAIQALADAVDATYTLTLADGRSFSVRFTGQRFEAEPIVQYNVADAADRYAITLYLMKV